jgi:hypothetical protein
MAKTGMKAESIKYGIAKPESLSLDPKNPRLAEYAVSESPTQ